MCVTLADSAKKRSKNRRREIFLPWLKNGRKGVIMTNQEILEGLDSLIKDRQSFFRKDGDDEIFRYDASVLEAAMKIVAAQVCVPDSVTECIKNNTKGRQE
jgi:hypothetical protein